MNKSFFSPHPYPLQRESNSTIIGATYMGSLGAKSPPLKSSLRQDILYSAVNAELGDLGGP